MIVAARFCCGSGRATPSRRRSKIAKPRIHSNLAGIHLNSAGRCPNKRNQLYFIGAACSVRDVIERIAKTFNVPDNNLLASTTDTAERALVSDLVRREGAIRIIPTISPPAQDV